MQPHSLIALLSLTAALLNGCADNGTVTEPRDPDPTHNYTNGPASPGPVVFRLHEPDWFVFLFPDFRADLTASVGLVERFSAFCDPGPVTIPPQDLQFLFSPTGRIAVLVQGRELPVVVYAGATTDFCVDLATAPIIARGTAHLVFNHRDLTSEASNGYRAQGTVALTAGGQAQFSGVVKFVTTPDGNTRVLVSQVILSPKGR